MNSRPVISRILRVSLRRSFAGVICFAALVSGPTASAGENAPSSATVVAGKLDALKETIAKELTVRMRTNSVKGSYTTVWRQFEDAAIEAAEEVLPRHIPELSGKSFDSGKTGREKNRL